MKKTILKTVKRVVEKTVIRSANTTSSLWAHQPWKSSFFKRKLEI